MFSEYGDLIKRLQSTDPHFNQLFEQHKVLDEKIISMEHHYEPATHEEIEILKKEKLRLKDQVYNLIKKNGG
ncbi:MAG: DUF465 domain-containing protein [Rhodoferax sp.]|nr:DUF465 domain-containing protein [Rhodoferax sp.]MCF8210517.1 DUF465 domain-containing protein [Rhodoferax sp.]